MRSRFLLALAAGTAALTAHQAHAWGPNGHAIIADIAERRLTPRASEAVGALLAGEGHHTLDEVASWADTVGHLSKRQGGLPETLPWHYVDTPVSAPYYVADRDCAGGNCIVEKLVAEEKVLADRAQSREVRLAALKWVVHLVGDIHQPLHVAERDGDKGGNAVPVSYYGDTRNGHMNLHALWDEGIIDHETGLTVGRYYAIDLAAARRYAETIETAITKDEASFWDSDLSAGDFRDAVLNWADESHALARIVVYGALPGVKDAALGDAYTELAWPVARLRLEQAGVRLAAALNAALDGD